nr:peptidylprolyl isomerase [Shimazuella soli]
MVIGSIVMGTTAYWQSNNKTNNANTQQQATTKPLDTSSQKIAGEYKGGKVTEGELNAYININSFFDPQLAALFSTTDASAAGQQKQTRQEIAKVYLTKKYIAGLQKVTPAEQKTIDQQGKELEKQVIEYSKMMGQNTKIANIQQAIAGKGFTQNQLIQVAEQDAKVDLYLGKQIENSTYERVKLRHVLISFTQPGTQAGQGQTNRTEEEAKKRALEVKQKLEAGGDFDKLAKEYSDDPGSKDKGGLYDSDVSGFVPAFANAAKTLPIGKISDPIKTEYGFHVMKVEARTQEKVKDAPKDQLEQIQNSKKQEVFSNIEKEIGVKLYI